MLKRSQVSPGDLLVKITGVGRMAVASVAPEGFEGNINQHICVIRTGSKELSELLAAFLNSDICEKLASRRSTGGTRPALDYSALLSIPIVEDKRILEITKRVTQQKMQNEAEAEKLLLSIDEYLLKELGIEVRELPQGSKNRVFQVSVRTISEDRFDPLYWQGSIYGELEKTIYPFVEIKKLANYLVSGFAAGRTDQNIEGEGIIQIRPTNIAENREFNFKRNVYIDFSMHEKLKKDLLIKGEVLFNNTNSQELVGKAIYFNLDGNYFCSNHITRIGSGKNCDAIYLSAILNLYQRSKVFFKSCINWNNQSGININILKKIKIPLPPIDKQMEIAECVTSIRQQAQQLRDKTNEFLMNANKEIESILLGDD